MHFFMHLRFLLLGTFCGFKFFITHEVNKKFKVSLSENENDSLSYKKGEKNIRKKYFEEIDYRT